MEKGDEEVHLTLSRAGEVLEEIFEED